MTSVTDMTQPPVSATHDTARLGRNDPLLQELWTIKATMNANAGYSIQKLADQARQFNLEATLANLNSEFRGLDNPVSPD
ncbi:hypothetical protein [Allochromatium palmeri]|uniref:Uncharacterized protein n=1 Tax=Allochromatium palmeri TaxID=231048 RepID=A0A6N8EEJ8_9GAMM|nr:hypothetical protein [Allochromatium palmeri]MTW22702.1 hypothetical protein [Allochromatium palmeri]